MTGRKNQLVLVLVNGDNPELRGKLTKNRKNARRISGQKIPGISLAIPMPPMNETRLATAA